ncbi:uncharacterized mitochondrial protein-like protein [Tanacetum coccineum]
MIDHLKTSLNAKFSIKDLGPLHHYLGIEFLRNKNGLALSQRKYALDLVTYPGLLDIKPSATPLDPNKKLTPDNGALLPDPSFYRTLVGKLLYLTITRLDLAFSAQALVFLLQEDQSHAMESFQDHCLLKEFQVNVPTPIPMMCDNASSIALASNSVHHARSKHIEIDCHFVRDKVKAGQILPQYISTKNQLSHYTCLAKLGMCNPYTLPTCERDDKTNVIQGSKHNGSVINQDAKHSVQSIQVALALIQSVRVS